MKEKAKKDDEIWITFSDILFLCRRAKKKIFLFIFFSSFLLAIYGLTKQVKYHSVATFREKSSRNSMNSLQSNFLSLFEGSRNEANGEALSTLQSQMLIKRLIKKLNLQAVLEPKENSFKTLSNIKDNIKIEWALFKKKQGPIFKDSIQPIAPIDIFYEGETPLRLKISFTSEENFEVFYSNKEPSIQGNMDSPLTVQNMQFALTRKNLDAVTGREFYLYILPIENVIKTISNQLVAETDKEDKTLIKLSYSDEDRYRAASILNTLMSLYQDYLKEYQQRMHEEQITYLRERQDEMQLHLRHMMNEHADTLSADVLNMGFPDVHSAIDFFALVQQKYSSALLEIDLELKRLEHLQEEGGFQLIKIANNDKVIDTIYESIHKLSRIGDSIELALGQSQEKGDISVQLEELQKIKSLSGEADQMIALLDTGNIPDSKYKLLDDTRFQVRNWCDRLASAKKEEREFCLLLFSEYLNHLMHLFRVQEKSLQEQLKNQRAIQNEFQGIDLDTAKELYIQFNHEQSKAESDMAEKQFILTQMNEPSFEISSLSTVLHDPVSQKMIEDARALLISLKDENNRSPREQERLKNSLTLQKQFILQHLDQTILLLKLKQNIFKEKIRSLQTTTLGLIQQEISVLEKHLTDYISSRQSQLYQEKLIVERHQNELQQEMAKLPNKWVSEKIIDQQMEMDKKMVEEISRLVEAKNTSNNLDLIQSAPVDFAIPSSQPKSPNLIVYLILGGVLGALSSMSFIGLKTIITGFPVTEDSLCLAQCHVSGRLISGDTHKPFLDTDLDTLRRMMRFLEANSSTSMGNIATLVIGGNPDYSRALALLMSKKGCKILLLPLMFNLPTNEEECPGLIQYLEGKANAPKMIHDTYCDVIYSGGISRFAYEALGSSRFNHLLKDLKKQYDWIFIVSRENSSSPEIEFLLEISEKIIVSIDNHKWHQVKNILNLVEKSETVKNISFILS